MDNLILIIEEGGRQRWENNLYFVDRYEEPDLIRLVIWNADYSSRREWRDFQQIKNQLGGKEHEGFELYPAESRLVDTANAYHIWIPLGQKLAFGYTSREVQS